jgi:acetate kinase
MVVLTVNTGSSSIKLVAFVPDATGLRVCGEAHYEPDATDPCERLKYFMEQHAIVQPRLLAHRVVHGGALLTSSRRIDAAVEAEIERIAPLAPLHNPIALTWIRACRAVFGADVPQVAVFDTAFYAQLPAVDFTAWRIKRCAGAGRRCARMSRAADA